MKKLLFTILFMCFCSPAFAGITAAIHLDKTVNTSSGQYDVKAFTATSDASGDIASTVLGGFAGHLAKVEIYLDETDTPATTSDIYINADNTSVSLDYLGGAGVNCVADGTDEVILPLCGGAYCEQPVGGDLYFVGDEMGATKTAIIKVWVRR